MLDRLEDQYLLKDMTRERSSFVIVSGTFERTDAQATIETPTSFSMPLWSKLGARIFN